MMTSEIQPTDFAATEVPLRASSESLTVEPSETTLAAAADGLAFQMNVEIRGVEFQDLEFQEEVEMVGDRILQPSVDLTEQVENIPDKMAFKIGEAAELVGVKQYVLRFWETEFDQLRPKKSKNNQRIYSRRDVETALLIRKLLYDDRFSIEGARAVLREARTQLKEVKGAKIAEQKTSSAIDRLEEIMNTIPRLRALFS